VDEDSLNRHLSYNRKCSRADLEATDKLSVLVPETNISQPRNNQLFQGFGTLGSGITIGEDDGRSSHQGNLVNYVNAFDLHKLHQMQTSLAPGEVRKMFYTTSLTKDVQGKMHKEFAVISVLRDSNCSQTTQPVAVINVNNDGDTSYIAQLPAPAGLQEEATNMQMPPPDNVDNGDLSNSLPPPEFELGGYYDSSSADEYGAEQGDDDEDPLEVDDISAVDENAASESNNNICHTCHHASPELDSLVDLYMLLDRRGVPNSLFDEISKWAWLNVHTFGRTPPMKRKVVVEQVFRHVRGDKYKDFMNPTQEVLRLSTGRHVAITYFPLEMMIRDMLGNSTLMEKDNLLFSDYKDPSNGVTPLNTPVCYGEVNSGSWWKEAMRHDCTGPNDILWPLIMFIDGMKVDNIAGKLKLEPVTFTFSRFKRWVRNQDNAWRTWAYMEDVKEPLFNEEDTPSITAKDRLQEYHDILGFLMKDLKRVQEKGIKWTLDFGEDGCHEVVLRFPLQFIIGDCEGHDKLVGRFKGHGQNIKGLCRDCDVPTSCSDDQQWECRFFCEHDLQNMTQEELRSYSFHKINNGFEGVSCGGCILGIRGCLNPEILHLFKAGHCEWVFDGFVFSLSSKVSEATKKVCPFIVNMNRGQSDRSFPNLGTFRDGIIKAQGVVLQGHEKHARLFFLYLMLCCSDFIRLLHITSKKGTEYDLSFYSDFLLMLEHCLGFYEWTMKREHSSATIIGEDGTTGTSIAQKSIRRYMFLLKNACPREEMRKNYKMTKFHQTLHLVPLIARHGSLRNTDSSRPESMAKGNVKDPASHTQRVSSLLSFQTGKRYMESLTFREFKRLKSEMGYDSTGTPYISKSTDERNDLDNHSVTHNNDSSNIFLGGTRFSISLDVDQPEGHYDVSINWKGKGQTPLRSFDISLVQTLGQRLFGAKDGGIVCDSEVPGCTAVQFDNITYNAHPLYKNDHPWHDWVYIKWDGYADPLPARIEMFFDLTNSEISNVDVNDELEPDADGNDQHHHRGFNHIFLEQTIYAVVWSAKSDTLSAAKTTDFHLPMNLGSRIELEEYRRIVPVSSFWKPCFGMLNMCGLSANFNNTAFVLKDRSDWADFFLSPTEY
jgi:hypothetical protein